MKFSIIVPVYNTEEYVGACIESVLAQSYQNYELMLVDDGSTDNSGNICEEYSKKDKRIRVLHKENSGQIEARCYGIKESVGDYIVFLDSDDLLAPNALEVIFNKFEQHKCDMLIYSAERFWENPNSITPSSNGKDILISDKKELYIKIFSTELYNSLCKKAIKKEFVNLNDYSNVKNVRYGEDLLQTIDIIAQNPKTVFIQDVLYYYRTNIKSLTQSIRIERYAFDIVFVRNAVYNLLIQENILTTEELYHYRNVAIKLLVNALVNISLSNFPISKKIESFELIKDSNYYKTFLNRGKYEKRCLGNKRIVWFLFRKKLYRMIVFILTFNRLLKRKQL